MVKEDSDEISKEEPNKAYLNKEESVEKAGSNKPLGEDKPIAFNEIKRKTVNLFKGFKAKGHPGQKKDDEDSIDFSKITSFTKKNSRWLIPLLLIIIAVSVSTYFRALPYSLPITDSWAENTVNNYYQQTVSSQIKAQYPNLPPQNIDALVNKELEKIRNDNKEQIERDLAQVSQQYKSQFQEENGKSYLGDIDTYLWYSLAKNVVNYGYLGDKKVDGQPYFSLRNGRLGKPSSMQMHPYFTAYFYKIISVFNKDFTVKAALFFMPVLIIGLSLIPAFFIGRRISNSNVGGFFSAFSVAISAPALSRTVAGVSDTDPYNVFFPLLIVWLFIESFYSKKLSIKVILAALAGLAVGLYAGTWTGWAHIFLILMAAVVASAVIVFFKKLREEKFNLKKTIIEGKKNKNLLASLLGVAIFFISSGIFVSIYRNFLAFQLAAFRVTSFTDLKAVGVKSIWPNVLTTVAEFNTASFSTIISQLGGNLLFWIGLMGIIILLLNLKKMNLRNWLYFIAAGLYYIIIFGFTEQLNNHLTFITLVSLPIVLGIIKVLYFKEEIDLFYPVLLSIWLLSTAYAFTKGVRFAMLSTAPFAIALGTFLGELYEKVSSWLNRAIRLNLSVSKIVILACLLILFITPLSNAKSIAINQIPLMNDAWYDSLMKIKNDSSDSIITSWWDFGHWFVALAERRVTFDGGDQGDRIHWVGKTLLTDNETEALGILKMLNCAQETAPHKLDEFTNDSLKSINILYDIFQEPDRNKALKRYQDLGLTKEQAEVIIEYTHCEDLLPNYFITSEDMVGKAGVWGHFGSWDFEKAAMYYNTNKLPRNEAVEYLTVNFNLTEEEADKVHNEIQNSGGDQWISSWPSYLSRPSGCQNLEDNKIGCSVSLQQGTFSMIIDLNKMDVTIENSNGMLPNSLVYAAKEGIKEKKFEGPNIGFSVILVPAGEGYNFILADPLQAGSTFAKLFFMEGHGMKCFEKFNEAREITGGKIITWKVDYGCKQENNVYFQPKEEINAAHLLISASGRTDEEALQLVNEIRKNITADNFDEYAEKYSDDPGSKVNGGELGWFRKGIMVHPFEDAAFALNKGQISQPVKTQFGYHLIYLIDKRII